MADLLEDTPLLCNIPLAKDNSVIDWNLVAQSLVSLYDIIKQYITGKANMILKWLIAPVTQFFVGNELLHSVPTSNCGYRKSLMLNFVRLAECTAVGERVGAPFTVGHLRNLAYCPKRWIVTGKVVKACGNCVITKGITVPIALILKNRVGCRSWQEMKVNFVGLLVPSMGDRGGMDSVIDMDSRYHRNIPLFYIKDYNSELLVRPYKVCNLCNEYFDGGVKQRNHAFNIIRIYSLGINMESSIFSRSAASNKQMTSGKGAVLVGRALGKINVDENNLSIFREIHMNAGLEDQIGRYSLRNRGKLKHKENIIRHQ